MHYHIFDQCLRRGNCSRKIIEGNSGESKNCPGITLPERGGAIVFPGRCAEAQEDPWEVVDPVRRSAAGVEDVLQVAVEAFYHPVGLRVVGSSLVMLDA
jgi:hypothetical protein